MSEETPRAPFKNKPTHTAGEGYEEEQDLVVLQGAAQPHEGHQEEEGAHADDSRHHIDAGHQAEPLPPGCHSNQQQAHQLRRRRRRRTMWAWKEQEVQTKQRISAEYQLFEGVLDAVKNGLSLQSLSSSIKPEVFLNWFSEYIDLKMPEIRILLKYLHESLLGLLNSGSCLGSTHPELLGSICSR